jgi:CheY-like chemotaxis protein
MLKKDTRRGETSASLIINHRQSSFVTANALSSTLGWTSLGRPAEVKDDAGGSDLFTSFETSGSDARNVEHGRCATVLEIAVEMTSCDEMSMRRVLLVEDDDVLRRNYETLLCAHRLSVCACATQSEAIAAFGHHTFDVVILDVTLGPDYEAGFVLCQTFREKNKTTPIIFLTEPRAGGTFAASRFTLEDRRAPVAGVLAQLTARTVVDAVLDTQGPVRARRRGAVDDGVDASRSHHSPAEHDCGPHQGHPRFDSEDYPRVFLHQVRASPWIPLGR